MRSIWKGSISFGLVSIPVKVISATESHSVSFKQIHTADGGRIRYRKVCELDDKEVAGDEIGKAYEATDGEPVLLTDEDMASLPLPTAKTVEILGFVPASDIDPIQLDRSYYLSGDGQASAKPYVLLREALNRSGKVAIAKLALRNRECLGMLRVYEDTLTLHTMLWPDEIRAAAGMAPAGDVAVRDAELDLADTLMDTLGELEVADLHDDYREAVETLVEAKRGGAPLPTEEERPAAASGRVVDLMAVLENSVKAARDSRGEEGGEEGEGREGEGDGDGEHAEVHDLAERSARKKAASGKGGAKKTSSGTGGAKKAAAGKGVAKKTASAKKTAAKKTAAKKTASGKKAASRPARKSA